MNRSPFDDRHRHVPLRNHETPDKIPYFALLVVMIGTTFYQQRQMQKASPPGAASGQQQAILKLMPIMFGIFGYTFPAGSHVYWTISNMWQIGQQYVLLKAGHIGPDAMERRIAEQRAKNANKPAKPGLMARSRSGRSSPEGQAAAAQEAERGRSRRAAPGRRKGPSQPARTPAKDAERTRQRRDAEADGRQHAEAGRAERGPRSAAEVTVARETEKRAPSVEEAVEAALHELGSPSRRPGSTCSRSPGRGARHRLA